MCRARPGSVSKRSLRPQRAIQEEGLTEGRKRSRGLIAGQRAASGQGPGQAGQEGAQEPLQRSTPTVCLQAPKSARKG